MFLVSGESDGLVKFYDCLLCDSYTEFTERTDASAGTGSATFYQVTLIPY